jgi:4-hydroxy-tetrahydrodipicolinate synthase
LRREVIELACRQIDGRLPVFVGITDSSSVESVNLADYAYSRGANALVVAAPYYFPTSQRELIEYIEDMLPRLQLPLLLYNMPSMTKIGFEIESLKHLTAFDGIVGVKDSSGDINYYKEVCKLKQLRSDWSILIGPEALLTVSMDLGGDGGISGGANVFPNLFVQCYEAKVAGDKDREIELSKKIDAFQELYTIEEFASKYIKATKCCLSVLGICDDFMERPFHRFKPEDRVKIKEVLERMNYREP